MISKLQKTQDDTIAKNRKQRKQLGVINPVHQTVERPTFNTDFSDLMVVSSSKTLANKQNFKQPIPEHLIWPQFQFAEKQTPLESRQKWGYSPCKKWRAKVEPIKRPATAGFNRSGSPDFMAGASLEASRANRTSILSHKKDLQSSCNQLKTKLSKIGTRSKIAEAQKSKLQDQITEAKDQLYATLQSRQMNQIDYQNQCDELDRLSKSYDMQNWKLKIISGLLKLQMGRALTRKEMKQMQRELDAKNDQKMIWMTNFIATLKKGYHGTKNPDSVNVPIDSIMEVLARTRNTMSEDEREAIIFFIEKVKKALYKSQEYTDLDTIPIKIFQDVVEAQYNSFEQQKPVISGFIADLKATYFHEVTLAKCGDNRQKCEELELRVCAEFCNNFLEKLLESINQKAADVERAYNRLMKAQKRTDEDRFDDSRQGFNDSRRRPMSAGKPMQSGGKPVSNVGKFARPIQSEEQAQIAEATLAARQAEQEMNEPFDPYKSIENKLRREQLGVSLEDENLTRGPTEPRIPDSSFKMVSMEEYEELSKKEVHLPEDIVRDPNMKTSTFQTEGLDLDFKPMAMQEKQEEVQESKYDTWRKSMQKDKPYDYDHAIGIYSGIINELRARERELLNKKRRIVYEINRPPKDGWYMSKKSEFAAEMHRNTMSLRPNDANRKLLTKLSVTDLY